MNRINIFLIAALFFLTGCTPFRYDGPYNGRIINADTAEPVEGVAVLGVWYKEYPGPAGEISEFHDARETVTDKNGEFSIPGMGPQFLSSVGIMNVMIFKAGFEPIEGTWSSFKIDLLLRKSIQWEGDKAIIPLRKLSIKERRMRPGPSRPKIPMEKMKIITREINIDRIEQGLSPL